MLLNEASLLNDFYVVEYFDGSYTCSEYIADSSNGRTTASGAVNWGSSP